MLSKISHTQKHNHCIISLICRIKKKSQTHGRIMITKDKRLEKGEILGKGYELTITK
jgi:hypothetical protein